MTSFGPPSGGSVKNITKNEEILAMHLKKCCCCISLRCGTKFTAFFQFLWFSFYLYKEYSFIPILFDFPSVKDTDIPTLISKCVAYFYFAQALLQIMMFVLLIRAIRKKNVNYLYVWLIVTIISIGLFLLNAVLVFFRNERTLFIIQLIIACLCIYFSFVVYSYSKELKSLKTSQDEQLQESASSTAKDVTNEEVKQSTGGKFFNIIKDFVKN